MKHFGCLFACVLVLGCGDNGSKPQLGDAQDVAVFDFSGNDLQETFMPDTSGDVSAAEVTSDATIEDAGEDSAIEAGSDLPTQDMIEDAPVELCGNGALDPGEQCDGVPADDVNCQTLGFYAGHLSCADCSFDTSQCSNEVPPTCGDGNVDAGEDCDGDNLAGSYCTSLGWEFTGGSLACLDCAFDASGCTPQCGNGVCEPEESYDSCPDDCPQPCLEALVMAFAADGPQNLVMNVNAHVARISLSAIGENAVVDTLTFRVAVQIATPDSDVETWRLKTETTLVIADYLADLSGDENGLVIFNINNPLTITPGAPRTLDIFVNTAEMDAATDTLQLWLVTGCGEEVEGPLLIK
ncbi:MAG TPA: hypothetical protein VMX18_02280 [Candidatus Bipolaricaulota bacterium]|nr:hypothetical protein [Candidatus Bipolaricaulota bacterium]